LSIVKRLNIFSYILRSFILTLVIAKALGTPARIFHEYKDTNLAVNHKSNTVVGQA
jgi:predicted alternative tryptophan synthase beta-subunit